ncbi:MAG TPA: response regulator transcription factor [Candidatus Limnocylindria bacterium]|jgi:two-component system alkaline phosphatase synthesis response regulator PhoP|nr:response regulator transcription factor [Candidatus Limnocylindria bacterium]
MATVLLVDDDPKIRELLRLYVEREGHRPLFAADGESALDLATRAKPDVVLLDVMLPGMDGFEVTRRLRDLSQVPILLLTARSAEGDRIIGLDLGADDYVVKPFSPRELMARVRALLRRHGRPQAADEPILVADGLALDPNAVSATLDGQPLELTPFEFRILLALMRRPNRVLTRDELIDALHGDDDPGIYDRTIDVHLGRLRRKLGDDASQPRFIGTVRTVGYRFVASVERRQPATGG